jgi:hypothetical protein
MLERPHLLAVGVLELTRRPLESSFALALDSLALTLDPLALTLDAVTLTLGALTLSVGVARTEV